MVNQKRLAWFRREISRFTTNEDEAWEFVLELLVTDWKEVAELDYETRKDRCGCCGLSILQRLLIDVDEWLPRWTQPRKDHVCSECESHVRKGYSVKCAVCKQKFISHSFFYYDGRGTKSFLNQKCPECEKTNYQQSLTGKTLNRECIACHANCTLQYSNDILVCLPCRETYHIDDRKIRIEYQKVNAHILRAESLNLPATLTLNEWFTRLIEANWTCQYCLTAPYDNLDHFIPLCKGGGTTFDNCVPACLQCNQFKGQRHPDKVTSISQEVLNRVRVYLQQSS